MSELRHLTTAEALLERDELNAEIRRLSARIAEDVERRRRLRADRDVLQRIVQQPRTGERRTGAGDLLVEVDAVAPLVRRWAAEFGPGAQRTLSELARVNVRTIRQVTNPASRRDRDHVSLETADRLLTATGNGWRVGELPVATRAQVAWESRRRASLEEWVGRLDRGCGDE